MNFIHKEIYPNLNCHDTWCHSKLVICQVKVALGCITEVHGHQVAYADDVTDGGKFARFLGLDCVAAISPVVFHG